MTLTRKLLALSAISALSLGMISCSDDSSGSDDPAKCSAKCDGTVAITCSADGTEVKTDCAKDSKVCNNAVCIDKSVVTKCSSADDKCDGNNLITCNTTTGIAETKACPDGCDSTKLACKSGEVEKCTAAENKCDGDTLQKCNTTTGVLGSEDCANGCDSAKLECKPECTAAEDKCDGNTLQKCDLTTGRLGSSVCKNGCDSAKLECISDADDPCAKCTAEQVCNAEKQCVDYVKESTIGVPCTCTTDDCHKGITISGKELKAVVQPAVSILIPSIKNIKDTDVITAPNFFSKDIQGCENVVAPAGMEVGCFRDETIAFPESVISFVKGLPTALGAYSTLLKGVDLDKVATTLSALLEKGISFTSPSGYCMAAAIDINVDLTGLVAKFINTDALKKGTDTSLVDKINAGDHSKAKSAVCPDGSVLLSYSVDKDISSVGTANVGFDICLKQCQTDDDCRKTDGYSCIEMPNGVPGDGQTTADLPTVKVCFDKKNVDYFTAMTEQFDALKPAAE